MVTPFRDAAEGLFLPAERARRGWFYVGLVLAGMLCLILLEVLTAFVIALLRGMTSWKRWACRVSSGMRQYRGSRQ